MAEAGEEVLLHVYDLSAGLAAQLSKALLGKQVDGVWHTGIVYKGTEYYYGAGIQSAPAGATPFGAPLNVIKLGRTQVPAEVFTDYLADMRTVWTAEAYSLFDNNCNNFSDEVAHFLTGTGIPSHILDLPHEVLATPFGQMLAPGLRHVQGALNSVQQPPQPAERAAGASPFSSAPASVTAAISDSLRAAAAAVVADTGIPLDAAATRQLAPQQREDSMRRLAEANAALSDNPRGAADAAAGLGRTSIGREHREMTGATVASTLGFPAPVSRRLTTARSGEIITRLGSGQVLPLPLPLAQPSPRPGSGSTAGAGAPRPPASAEQASARRVPGGARPEPREPKDGTKAQPGPSSAKIAGLNAGVAFTMERSNSGRTPAGKAAFEAAVRREFARLMAEGGCSPNEAAAQAIRRAATTA